MAEDIKKVIDVSVDGAQKSLRSLRQEVSALRDNLLNLEQGTEEYNKTAEQIADIQEEINTVMKAGKKETDAAEGSYNHLVKTMGELKKQWRATADEAERDAIGKQILEINNQLKDLDASTGNYQRNVGDYKNAIVDAFNAFGGSVGAVTGKIQGATTALKAMSKVPIVFVIGALVSVLDAVIKNLKTSEDNINAVTASMANFQAIGDLVTKAIQGLGQGIAWLAQEFSDLLDTLGLVNDKMKERQALTKDEIALEKQKRNSIVSFAKDELAISELRAKAADKAQYSAEERQNFLKQAMDLEKGMAEERLRIAEQEFDIAQRNAALSENDKATNDALAQAEANLYNARKAYFDKSRELITQYNEARNQQVAEEKARIAEEQKWQQQFVDTDEIVRQSVVEQVDNEMLTEIDIEKRKQEELARLRQEGGLNAQAILAQNFAKEIEGTRKANADIIRSEKDKQAQRKQIAMAGLATASGLFSALGDLIESDTEVSEKEARRAKNLKIASSTIDTIMGSIAAYMSAQELPFPANFIIGAANAATVLATGFASINKIKSQQVNKDNSSSVGSVSIPNQGGASVTPAVVADTPVMRSLTSASEEDRLNRMAGDQRVYLVYSDVQAAGRQVEVQDTESSF